MKLISTFFGSLNPVNFYFYFFTCYHFVNSPQVRDAVNRRIMDEERDFVLMTKKGRRVSTSIPYQK